MPARGRLHFTTDLAGGVEGAEAVFIAVGTPARRGDGHADLTFVYAAVRELAQVDRAGRRWSSPSRPSRSGPATAIVEILAEEGVEGASVASNPEFLREGAAIRDFKIPDRIVVGAEDERAPRGAARNLPAAVPQPGADPVHRRGGRPS